MAQRVRRVSPAIKEAVEDASKTFRWRLRASVGQRVAWRREIEETRGHAGHRARVGLAARPGLTPARRATARGARRIECSSEPAAGRARATLERQEGAWHGGHGPGGRLRADGRRRPPPVAGRRARSPTSSRPVDAEANEYRGADLAGAGGRLGASRAASPRAPSSDADPRWSPDGRSSPSPRTATARSRSST